MKVGIINVTGYAGMELARILLRHPEAEITSITGRSMAGKDIGEVFPHLAELDMTITEDITESVDVVFSALPHAASAERLAPLIRDGVKAVDISADFRLKDLDEYEAWYGTAHPCPELLEEAVYGLPELHRDEIEKTSIVGNPGCYPSASILALAPALKAGIIEPDIIIDAKSGVSGAGRGFSAGFDISPGQTHEAVPPTAHWDATHLASRTIMKLWNLRQPTICAVNGHALAAGNVLAMTADIVIAADNAVFGEPEVRFVAHSPAIMLPYMIPFRHLNWLYFTGDTVDALTAERWNMVNKVVPADTLMEEAMRVARRIASVPPYAAQMMKRSIKGAYENMGFTSAFENHLMIRMIEGMADDVPEKEALRAIREEQGMRAFLQARDAPFVSDS